MKNVKTILLTIILSIGFIFPSCDKDKLVLDPCGDKVRSSEVNRYFDIIGLETTFFQEDTIVGFEYLSSMDTISFAELGGIFTIYEVEYHANHQPFSLIPSTMACSYVPGYLGSKTEQLNNLTVTTLNDFDETHLANESINDLLIVKDVYKVVGEELEEWVKEEPSDLTVFLANQTENIFQTFLKLQLKKAPELNQELKFKIKVELSTGEVYETESDPVYIKD